MALKIVVSGLSDKTILMVIKNTYSLAEWIVVEFDAGINIEYVKKRAKSLASVIDAEEIEYIGV